MTTRPIRFFHRGALVEIDRAAPTRTVLEWLREDAHCTGTKEGCAEGDCGACTVVIGELAASAGSASLPVVDGLALRSVNACIQFLPTLDGKALFGVEDLKALNGGALHPVQQAMVECHGSQCGFCTPGFVMSLWSSYEKHQACGSKPTRQSLADDLSGNLCRCTGYRPILDAGERMFALPAVRFDAAPVVKALQSLQSLSEAADGFAYAGGGFHAPRTLDELAALRVEHPTATLLAGSTDVGLWVTKQFRELGTIVSVGEVAELKRIAPLPDGGLEIGAGASLEDAWRALAARHPSLQDVWLRFASLPIRNAGTMGGNVANGSPIGDSAPVLIALGARIVLRRGERLRTMPLHEFYLDYMKNQLEPGEFVQAVQVPPPAAGDQLRAYKISKRFDCDISAVCAGLAIRLDGERVAEARFAWGGMAATVRHARRAEAAVIGQPWTPATVQAAQAALAEDFTPLSDMRASAEYRLLVAQNLLQRLWLETRPTDPLPVQAVSVWATMPHAAAAV